MAYALAYVIIFLYFCARNNYLQIIMSSFLRKTILFVAVLFGTMAHAIEYTPATVPDPKINGQDFYVANPDAIIADSDVVFLNKCAASLQKQTDVELCVVALSSIGDADCFEFCYELFQRWGIGGKGKNTGVLMFFALESHDFRIMTGTGIEGVLTDAECSRIYHSLIPIFRDGDYGGGLCIGAMKIYEVCTDGEAPEELKNMKSVTNRGKYANASSSDDDDAEGWGTEGWIILGMVLFCISLGFIEKWRAKKKCPKCGKRTNVDKTVIKEHATYLHGGNGIKYYKCPKCGHEWSMPFKIAKLTHSSSGSSSGGGSSWSSGGSSGGGGGSWGGGSTSGGGAGGKW